MRSRHAEYRQGPGVSLPGWTRPILLCLGIASGLGCGELSLEGGPGKLPVPADGGVQQPPPPPDIAPAPNARGAAQTFYEQGVLPKDNGFFQARGNGRACDTCHSPLDGWSLVPARVRE